MKGKPLSETHPELAAQAVGWDPTEVTPGSGQKRLWRCTQSHEWEAQILNRVNGTGCPYCAGRLMTGVNDLATTHPELANEADGWNPTLITAGSGKKVNWKCEYGHQWKAAISNRVNGTGCPVCAGRKVVPGFNDFATLNPELALEADGWDPTTVLAGTHTKYSWSCPNSHNYSVSPGERQIGRGCPVCAGKRVVPGFNDFATLNPELALEADGWDPTTVTAHSKKKLPWRCLIGHNFLANTQGRSNGEGCPVCAGKQVLIGFNDLATLNPELALEADGWDPTTVTAHSGRKLSWRCPKHHRYEMTPNARSDGAGCPFCSGNRVLAGFNDLATLNPELALEADGWDPTTVTAGSNKKHGWRCALGHRYLANPKGRGHGEGCPVCAGKQVLIGFNDLATLNPELALEADGWDPTTVTAGSNKKQQWMCEFGHKWSTAPSSRKAGRGCPSCATTGFDPNADGWLYFLSNELWGLLQIGITNDFKRRLKEHGAQWDVVEVRGPMPGGTTYQWEQDVLHSLKRRGVELAPEHIAGKFSGYTEAWVQEDFPAKSLTELMNLVHEDEE